MLVGVKGFIHTTKQGNVLLIYVLPIIDVKLHQHEILSQYKENKEMFEKKNVDNLWKHEPYDGTIEHWLKLILT